MARKKHRAEQIVAILRQIEVEVANHKPTGQACREAGITEQTYYRWRKEYGGLKLEQATPDEGNWRRRTHACGDWWRSCRWRSKF